MAERTIFKYPIHVGRNEVVMPTVARVLSVGFQTHVGVVMWALVEPFTPTTTRVIHVFGTGSSVDDIASRSDFVGTIQDPHGFVWHAFVERVA